MKAWTVDSAYFAPNPGVDPAALGTILADVLNDQSRGNLTEFLGDIFLVFCDDGVPLGFAAGWEQRHGDRRVFQLQFFLVRPRLRGFSSSRLLSVLEGTVREFGYIQIILPIRKDRERFIRAMETRYGYIGYTDPDDDQNRWFYKNL